MFLADDYLRRHDEHIDVLMQRTHAARATPPQTRMSDECQALRSIRWRLGIEEPLVSEIVSPVLPLGCATCPSSSLVYRITYLSTMSDNDRGDTGNR